ncbi:MAG TPA: D-alanyl-D-alanine carboxypeptidase family protein [Pelomicrobium sp.]|nr:D-alanyl-D-alanine carboxypeptidase family protein [Pelomicrobium sp.]
MKRLLFLFLLGFSLASAAQAPAPVPQPPAIEAKAWLLMDFHTGQVIAEKGMHERVEPASLTKLMTAYLAFAALKKGQLKLDQEVQVSEKAWKAIGSRMFIEPRKPVTVEELLRGMIVQSGNDASIALAEAVAGSEEVFAQMMNREAERLGMKNTRFTNSTGLPDPELYSTPYDLALLAAAIIRDFPEHYPMYSEKEYTYNKIKQANRNRLLWTDPNVDGVKTGHTEAAGYCLVASAKRDQRRYISVVMGTGSERARAIESQKLLNFALQFYDTVKLYAQGQSIATMPVWKGKANEVKAGFNRDVWLTLPRGQRENLKATLERKEPLLAPVQAGQQVGTLRLALDGQPVAEYAVVALDGVPVAGIFGRAWDSIKLLFN